MPTFKYRGRDQHGELRTGKLDADSANAAATQLYAQQITPLDIVTLETQVTPSFNSLVQWFRTRHFNPEELIFFCRQMRALSKAGVPIITAITRIADTTRSRILEKTLRGVVEKLLIGNNLTTALSHFPYIFPPLFINMINAGESSGQLEQTFMQLSAYLQMELKTRNRIKQASRYPILVTLTMVAAFIIINIVVIPTFAKLFKQFNLPLPWTTRLLISTSDFTSQHWLSIAMLLAGSLFILMYYRHTPRGRYYWDQFKLKLPVLGSIFQRIILSRFAATLAMIVEAGLPVLQAITLVAAALDNAYISKRILTMRTRIEHGESLYISATNTRLFSPLVLQMLAIGEESGNIEEMLKQTAEFYDNEVDYDISRLSDLIQPIMIIGLGILVLLLALGVLLPTWDLVKLARQ